MLRVVQHSGHSQSKVGAEQMDEDGVSSVHSPEVVSSNDLIDHEDDGLEDGHDHELGGGSDPKHHPEWDEDSGSGEVCRDEGPDIDINEGPAARALVRTKLDSGGNSILANLINDLHGAKTRNEFTSIPSALHSEDEKIQTPAWRPRLPEKRKSDWETLRRVRTFSGTSSETRSQ